MIVDTREHAEVVQRILDQFDRLGVRYIRQKIDAGDYQIVGHPEIVVDRKQNLQEVSQNVLQEHERFKNELLRAREHGTHIVILIEHGSHIKAVSDVHKWHNPRLKYSPEAMTGERLEKIMNTMADRYGCEWQFCTKDKTGQRILEILKEGVNE